MLCLKYKWKALICSIIAFLIVELHLYRNLFIKTTNVKINESKNDLKPTIFCIIHASPSNIKSKIKAVHETWANECNKYLFVAIVTEPSLNASLEIELNGLMFLQPKNMLEDRYDLLTEKMFQTLVYMYQKYNFFDWYLKADDDTFILFDNLRNFLSTKNSSKPVTYGCEFRSKLSEGYRSGGAGYVFSNEAFKRIGSHLASNYSFCKNTGTEDVDMARCFHKLGVYSESSLDESNRERFHPFNFSSYLNNMIPDWIRITAKHPVKRGKGCCSQQSISFHYENEHSMRKLKSLIDTYKLENTSLKTDFITYLFSNYNK